MTAEQLTAASTLADRRLSACIDVHHHMLPPVTIEPMAKLGFDDARLKAIARENALRLFPRLRG